MNEVPYKLTVEEIEGFSKLDGGILRTLGLQYLDVMLENKRLRETLTVIAGDKIFSIKEGGGTLPSAVAQIAQKALKPYKHSDNDSPEARRIRRKLEKSSKTSEG